MGFVTDTLCDKCGDEESAVHFVCECPGHPLLSLRLFDFLHAYRDMVPLDIVIL